MSPRRSDARQRLVCAAAQMLAQHGLNATSIREMAKRAEAPLGSTYHHFPGGKYQMVIEAVIQAGARVSTGLEHHLQTGFLAGVRGFLSTWRQVLLQSEFRKGCPVVAAAVEEPTDEAAEAVLRAAADVFAQWEQTLSNALMTEGHEKESAADIATFIVASVEGAIVLCRAQRNVAPFDRVTRILEHLAIGWSTPAAPPPDTADTPA